MHASQHDAKNRTSAPAPPPKAGNGQTAGARRAHTAWQKGLVHARQGEWPAAERCFRNAARPAPAEPVYALNLARALHAQSRYDDAAQAAARAFGLAPRNELACAFTAKCLMDGKRFRDAAHCLESLSADAPRGFDYHATLGRAHQFGGRPREAVNAYMNALALDLTHADTHYQLGLCLNDLGLKTEAVQCFHTALAMGADGYELGVRGLLAIYEREACRWDDSAQSLAALKAALDRLPADAAVSTAPFAHVTLIDDPAYQLKAAASLSRHLARRARPLPARVSDWRPVGSAGGRRLRVGYLSADFHNHATCILMAEMLERHDRARFEVTLYSHGKDDGTAMRRRIERACEHFVDLRDRSDRDIAERIRADGCDLLIDLKGYTRDSRISVFAWKPAPVSATFLGFAGTTGADGIDYLIGDPVVTPLAHQPWYSERLAQMPVCYQPNDRQRALAPPPPRAAEGLPDDALVLAGFNQPYKISPEVFDVWCVLLDALPQAVLWLLEWNEQSRDNLMREAARRGVAPGRIVWAPFKAPAEHVARMQLADLFIDTWPCNAHTRRRRPRAKFCRAG
jgi:predicted O-linked N-acetylglucosamine transferase (SPINDLY family)